MKTKKEIQDWEDQLPTIDLTDDEKDSIMQGMIDMWNGDYKEMTASEFISNLDNHELR
jgi:hypothetical protein